jgi:hypothetical protein
MLRVGEEPRRWSRGCASVSSVPLGALGVMHFEMPRPEPTLAIHALPGLPGLSSKSSLRSRNARENQSGELARMARLGDLALPDPPNISLLRPCLSSLLSPA